MGGVGCARNAMAYCVECKRKDKQIRKLERESEVLWYYVRKLTIKSLGKIREVNKVLFNCKKCKKFVWIEVNKTCDNYRCPICSMKSQNF